MTTAQVLTGEPPPVDGRGFLDAAALATKLRSHPVTRRRPILVRRILEVVAAPPEARPRALRVWLDGAADSLSQVTGPGPNEPPAADPPLAPPAGGRRRTAAPAGRPRRRWSLLVVMVGLAVLLAARAASPGRRNPGPDGPGRARPASRHRSGRPMPTRLVAAPVGDFVGPMLGPSGRPTAEGTVPAAPADSGGSPAARPAAASPRHPPAAPTSILPAPRPAAVAAGGSTGGATGGATAGLPGHRVPRARRPVRSRTHPPTSPPRSRTNPHPRRPRRPRPARPHRRRHRPWWVTAPGRT